MVAWNEDEMLAVPTSTENRLCSWHRFISRENCLGPSLLLPAVLLSPGSNGIEYYRTTTKNTLPTIQITMQAIICPRLTL